MNEIETSNSSSLNIVKRLIFYSLLILIIVTCLEFGSKLFLHIIRSGGQVVSDKDIHHKWNPDFEHIDSARSIPYTHKTNSQSWVENYNVSRQKPEDVYRIFFVGDSNTQGVVDTKYKMVEIVEKSLNKLYKNGKVKFEIINTGTSSYSPLLYYLSIKKRILAYSPNLVLVNIDMNDIVNDCLYRDTLTFDENGEIDSVSPSRPFFKNRIYMTQTGIAKVEANNGIYLFLVNNFSLFELLDRILVKIFLHVGGVNIDKEREDCNWLAKEITKETAANYNFSMDIIEKTAYLLRTKNVKVGLSGVPHHNQFTGKASDRPHAILKGVALKAGIPYLNTYEKIREKYPTEKIREFYWKKDLTHFNIEGNTAWAEIYLNFLTDKRNDLLPFGKDNN